MSKHQELCCGCYNDNPSNFEDLDFPPECCCDCEVDLSKDIYPSLFSSDSIDEPEPSERLTTIHPVDGLYDAKPMVSWRDVIDKLAYYENLNENGLLRIFPCSVGDNIYALESRSPNGIEVVTCKQIRVLKNSVSFRGGRCKYDDWGAAFWQFPLDNYGISWFATEAEAQSRLEENKKLHNSQKDDNL